MKKLNKVYIEITNHCNLNCSFCSIDNRKKEWLSLSNFKHILKEISPYTDYVYLHVKGEPLLHPELDSILTLCEKYSKKVNITTNGTLLKERKDLLLKHSCIRQINISLHSENNKTNYLEDIFEVVEQLLEHSTISYRFWTLKEGCFNEKSTEIVNKMIDFYHLSTETVDKIKTENNFKIKDHLFISKDNEFIWADLENDYYEEKGYCYALKTHVAILVDGTVVPCCLDSKGIVNLGNIYEEPFQSIMEKERTTKIRTFFNNRKACEELCKHCSFKKRFDK